MPEDLQITDEYDNNARQERWLLVIHRNVPATPEVCRQIPPIAGLRR